METLANWFFNFLSLIFALGWIGCLATIPMAAYKFVSVLFEKDTDEPENHREYKAPSPMASLM